MVHKAPLEKGSQSTFGKLVFFGLKEQARQMKPLISFTCMFLTFEAPCLKEQARQKSCAIQNQ